MNKFQKLLNKINDEKQKVEKEYNVILDRISALYYIVDNVKTSRCDTKYGRKVVALYEKTLAKLFDIKRQFEQEYGALINVTAEENNEQEGGADNE